MSDSDTAEIVAAVNALWVFLLWTRGQGSLTHFSLKGGRELYGYGHYGFVFIPKKSCFKLHH